MIHPEPYLLTCPACGRREPVAPLRRVGAYPQARVPYLGDVLAPEFPDEVACSDCGRVWRVEIGVVLAPPSGMRITGRVLGPL